MKRLDLIASTTLLCLGCLYGPDLAIAQTDVLVLEMAPAKCAKFHIDNKATRPLQPVAVPPEQVCATRLGSKGLPIPDPACTPGAINTTVTAAVLQDPDFTTKCIRNQVTTEEEKARTYEWYSIRHPVDNEGQNQTCELDHLVSLELGGADTLDNLWPQCGPDEATLHERFFKQKDLVEDHLGALVKEGRMDLAEAQKAISGDWTTFLEDARRTCLARTCKGQD